MMQTIQTGVRGQLTGRLWIPNHRSPIATVVVVHGLGDHSGRYESLAKAMLDASIAMVAFDLPGHGQSPGRRGHISDFREFLTHIDAVRKTMMDHLPHTPQVLLGHSMGGNLAVNYVLRAMELNSDLPPVDKLVLVAPMLLPPNPPPRPWIFAAWLTGHLLPWIEFRQRFDDADATAPSTDVPIPDDDHLLHGRISMYLATQLLAQGRWALDHARDITVPTLVIDGELDTMVDRAANYHFTIRMGIHATYQSFSDSSHHPLLAGANEQVIEALTQWITLGHRSGANDGYDAAR
jgi:alpha-beta hydrolase superfamily lysophospholipase